MVGYYDIVLGLIPLALCGIAVVLTALGASLTTAVPLASVVSVALIGHAMFVNGPVDRKPAVETATTPDDTGFQSAD